jgi:hypothetical protein
MYSLTRFRFGEAVATGFISTKPGSFDLSFPGSYKVQTFVLVERLEKSCTVGFYFKHFALLNEKYLEFAYIDLSYHTAWRIPALGLSKPSLRGFMSTGCVGRCAAARTLAIRSERSRIAPECRDSEVSMLDLQSQHSDKE